MQRAFRELADEQLAAVGQTGLRVAVNTGEVVANDATEIIGDPVNVAARLQEEARDGGVVIGEATRRLVAELVTLAPLGSFSLKGRAKPWRRTAWCRSSDRRARRRSRSSGARTSCGASGRSTTRPSRNPPRAWPCSSDRRVWASRA